MRLTLIGERSVSASYMHKFPTQTTTVGMYEAIVV